MKNKPLISLNELCIQQNMKLNAGKLQFKTKEVKFMGNIITSGKIKANPATVSAIIQMPTPCNKAAVLRFINMVIHLFPFCEHLLAAVQPLRNLNQNSVLLSLSKAQDDAFSKAKENYFKFADIVIGNIIWTSRYSYKRTQVIKTWVAHDFNLMNTADWDQSHLHLVV